MLLIGPLFAACLVLRFLTAQGVMPPPTARDPSPLTPNAFILPPLHSQPTLSARPKGRPRHTLIAAIETERDVDSALQLLAQDDQPAAIDDAAVAASANRRVSNEYTLPVSTRLPMPRSRLASVLERLEELVPPSQSPMRFRNRVKGVLKTAANRAQRRRTLRETRRRKRHQVNGNGEGPSAQEIPSPPRGFQVDESAGPSAEAESAKANNHGRLEGSSRRVALRPWRPVPRSGHIPPDGEKVVKAKKGFVEVEREVSWIPAEEREKIAEMRRQLSADLAALPPWPELVGDIRLLRYLRKCNGESEAAVRLYQSTIVWRRENDVDRIREDIVQNRLTIQDIVNGRVQFLMLDEANMTAAPNGQLFNATQDDLIRSGKRILDFLPIELAYGFSEETGEMVQYLSAGRWNTRGIGSAWMEGRINREEFLRFWVYIAEVISIEADRLSRRQRRLTRVHEIVDVSGCSVGQVSKSFFKLLKPWVQFVQSHYPETNRDILFCRTPFIFSFLWSVSEATPATHSLTHHKTETISPSLPVCTDCTHMCVVSASGPW